MTNPFRFLGLFAGTIHFTKFTNSLSQPALANWSGSIHFAN